MARHNDLTFFGRLLEKPMVNLDKITMEPTKASFFLQVVNQDRENGIQEDGYFFFEPFVYTEDKALAAQISQFDKGDLVELRGVLTTLDANRSRQCVHCGHVTTKQGEITLITPSFIELRYTGLSDSEALDILKKHREISNRVTLIGYLCDDVKHEEKSKIYGDILSQVNYKGISRYQIAVNRKLFVKSDDPLSKTDYPHIISIGERAEVDSLALHKGSMVLVDGMVVTRRVRRVCECSECKQKYDWDERVTEVITYNTEYLENYNKFTDVAAEKQARQEQKLNDIKSQVFSNSIR